jgi:hypothetical protein
MLTARWDIIAWNELASRLLRDYAKLPPERRNLLRILLVDDAAYQRDAEAYEMMVRRLLAKFRVDYSHAVGDPSFDELIADLEASCPVFHRLWGLAEVVAKHEAVVTLPQAAGITFEHSSYVPEGSPNLRLVIFAPYDEDSAAKVRKVAAEIQREAEC